MSATGRILGVDYGTVRIGLAVTDPERIIASPLATYERQNAEKDEQFFVELVRKQEVTQIVVGLPVHNDGRVGEKANEALQFGSWLTNVARVPVVYFDERFTTVEAESHLRGAGLSHRKRRERRDRVAAQVLLNAYLQAGCPSNYEPTSLGGEA